MRHRSWQKAKTLGIGGVNQPGVIAVKKKLPARTDQVVSLSSLAVAIHSSFRNLEADSGS